MENRACFIILVVSAVERILFGDLWLVGGVVDIVLVRLRVDSVFAVRRRVDIAV